MEEAFRQLLGNFTGNSMSIAKLTEEISSGDDFREMQGLVQLCDLLNNSSEGALMGIRSSDLVSAICVCLQKDYNPELVLLAARSLTYLIDSAPNIIHLVCQPENLELILAPLVNVEDIEVAQQCVDCLEKLSEYKTGAHALYNNNGLSLMLTFLDFFTLSTQKKIWHCVCSASRYAYPSTFNKIKDTLPLIQKGVENEDSDVSIYCSHALMNILFNVAESASLVKETFGDLLPHYIEVSEKHEEVSKKAFEVKMDLLFVASSFSYEISESIIKSSLLTSLGKLIDQFCAGKNSLEASKIPLVNVCNVFSSLFCPNVTGPMENFMTLYALEVPKGKRSIVLQLARAKEKKGKSVLEDTESAEGDGAEEEESSDDSDTDEKGPKLRSFHLDEKVLFSIRKKVQDAGIPVANRESFKGCNIGHHICDCCGKKNLPSHDWFRCNECEDNDYCSSCLLKDVPNPESKHHTHTFTDMYVLLLPGVIQTVLSDNDKKKLTLYSNNSDLIRRLLQSAEQLVRVCCSVEVLNARISAFLFLIPLVKTASLTALQEGNFFQYPLGELITSNLYDQRSLCCNLLSLTLAKTMLEKGAGVVQDLFRKERVLQANAKLQENLKRSGVFDTEAKQPLYNTKTGWRTVLLEASRVFESTLSVEKVPESPVVQQCREHFQKGEYQKAFERFTNLLDSKITPFELSASHLLDDLQACLGKSGTMEWVTEFFVQLISQSKNDALKYLISLLQRLISYEDDFFPPRLGVESVHSLITIKLIPQREKVPSGEEGAGGEERRRSRGKAAGVGVTPLTEMKALRKFVNERLLPGVGQMRGLMSSSEESVEEVTLSKKNHAPAAKSPSEGVYLRCGNFILPDSLTALQIIESSDLCTVEKAEDTDSINALIEGMKQQKKEIILHYSREPFEDKYEYYSVPRPPAYKVNSAEEKITVLLPSQMMGDQQRVGSGDGVGASTQVSDPFLSEGTKKILSLTSLLYRCTTQWQELLKAYNVVHKTTLRLPLPIDRTSFVHPMLDEKAQRHCSNYLFAGRHTSLWAVNVAIDYPFLFSFDTRKFMFDVSFCGTVRSAVKMQAHNTSVVPESQNTLFRPVKEKKRVWRDRPLETFKALFGGERRSGLPMWEFEYFSEPGTGLGPTRQFYSSVGEALLAKSLDLWYPSEDDTDQKFNSRNGLYPKLLGSESDKGVEEEHTKLFQMMGRFIARAILDDHTASLSLSEPLLKMIRGDQCNLNDVQYISKGVYDVLTAVTEAVYVKKSNSVSVGGTAAPCKVEDLSLTFTVPGKDSMNLLPGGDSMDVTFENCGKYCDGVVEHLLKTCVQSAVTALRKGLDDYIPLVAFRLLSIDELHEVISGAEVVLAFEDLSRNCVAAHGFTPTCKHIIWFYEILSSFSLEEQKLFILFLTGSPRLPLGGLTSLKPPITIVRKSASEANLKEEDQLPSAMTCQNYLKLPAYNTKEQMEQKIRQAMNEGTGAFLLT